MHTDILLIPLGTLNCSLFLIQSPEVLATYLVTVSILVKGRADQGQLPLVSYCFSFLKVSSVDHALLFQKCGSGSDMSWSWRKNILHLPSISPKSCYYFKFYHRNFHYNLKKILSTLYQKGINFQ